MSNQGPAFSEKFQNDRRIQFRVLAVAGGLLFFILPAMVAGSLVLYDLFISSGTLIPTENGQMLVGEFINQFVPRVAVIGIVFGIGLLILLVATRGFPELENIFIWLGFVMVGASIMIGSILTFKCRDGCDTNLYATGIISVLMLTILGYVVPVMAGKRVGWFALFFIPLLAFQVIILLPYLFMTDQTGRTTEDVVKNILLVFTSAGLIAWIGYSGGWKRPK